MAGASDKARFFQEQSVPELQEFARKKTFSKEEIASIARKRSDFEHIINARGSKPQDYARYAEYETNLESLRRKRVTRLGVKTSNHTGQRRIFFVLDRATKKFPGDVGLWMQYITFAQKQGSNQKVSQILTSVLRLHPTKPELWIYAATMRDADMTEARSYMQRGLRFCGSSEKLWIEYARLEMIHVSKIAGRRRILGLDGGKVDKKSRQDAEGDDEDMMTLPAITAENIMSGQRPRGGAEQEALVKLGTSPALLGAIPMAIFDAAMRHFKEDNELCQQFFDVVAEFHEVPCQKSILSHMMDTLRTIAPKSPGTLIRWIQQPVIGTDVKSPEFPALFVDCLDRIKRSFEILTTISTPPKTARPMSILGQQVIAWMLTYQKEDIDADVRKVIRITIRKVESISGRL
ncbi:hypothetical protein HO133_005121 [Letharia lupina]|uniref:U3 small nucleolar RNA-associated protein 6 N-terminal domain-containing protein n=1 Tax=Letharia lupina TaxID=560253 RepID=A0A8H6C9Y2_9LECA|nr:uncharacterized protein HO133_005121 [Letharia lupina]KAF6219296.1 hypothetical protein HO133_005121 [Letharia lupina]